MISSEYIIFLIFFHIIKHAYSQESPKDILGPSACDCYGRNYNFCKTPDAPVESLPKNCSSYLYLDLLEDNNTLVDEGEKYGAAKGYLDQLIKTNITVLVYYYHINQTKWCVAVKSDLATQTAEMNNLKLHLDKHPGIKGIILHSLLDMDSEVTSTVCPDYTQNLKKYIDLMHKTFTQLSIGIFINAKRARDLYNSTDVAWLEYKGLDSSVDFYVVNFDQLNTCSDNFIKTGCFPLTGNDNNTVVAMKTFLDNVGVPSTKVHYVFYSYGDAKDKNRTCDANPIKSCKNVPFSKTSICMDTLQTLYDKGAFAKTNGAGFIVSTIDADDFDSSCQCDQLFPAFHALLSGFNGGPPPKPCALYDRT